MPATLVPVAPVNETDMVLFPEGLKALKRVAKEVGLDLRGAYLNLDGGFDSAHNRKCIFNAGMIPNIKENPRNRKHTKRGRKRLFNAVIHALRMHVERTFAWEDKFKRLLLRFERIQQRHYGMKLMAYVSGTRICRKTVDLKMRTTKGVDRVPPACHEAPVATPSEAGFTIRVAPSCDSSCLQ
jgi:Transposase DDE domain